MKLFSCAFCHMVNFKMIRLNYLYDDIIFFITFISIKKYTSMIWNTCRNFYKKCVRILRTIVIPSFAIKNILFNCCYVIVVTDGISCWIKLCFSHYTHFLLPENNLLLCFLNHTKSKAHLQTIISWCFLFLNTYKLHMKWLYFQSC